MKSMHVNSSAKGKQVREQAGANQDWPRAENSGFKIF